MSPNYDAARKKILKNYKSDLSFGQSDLKVLSDVNRNVLLTNYLTLKGTAFSNIDRECWKYLASYNIQFFCNWDVQEVCDIKLSGISYVNDHLLKIENGDFFGYLPSLDKSELSPITILACFLWDRMNVYDDHNRDLPVVNNTDSKSSGELKYRIATNGDLKSKTKFFNDVPLFRGKSVLQPAAMNTVAKQYSKATQLINKSYKKNEFFVKLVNDLYSQKALTSREINKPKILEYLSSGKDILKPINSMNASAFPVDPILRDLEEESLNEALIDLYQTLQAQQYDQEVLLQAEKEVVKLQIYTFVVDNFKLIFPDNDKLVSVFAKHLLIGVPTIYCKLPHGLIRTSFNHLKNLPGFPAYWEKMLEGKNQTIDYQIKTKLNSGEQLGNENGGKPLDLVSLDVIKLSLYKEIYENCKDFNEFREYLLMTLLKHGIPTSKSKKLLGKKRKLDSLEEEEEVAEVEDREKNKENAKENHKENNKEGYRENDKKDYRENDKEKEHKDDSKDENIASPVPDAASKVSVKARKSLRKQVPSETVERGSEKIDRKSEPIERGSGKIETKSDSHELVSDPVAEKDYIHNNANESSVVAELPSLDSLQKKPVQGVSPLPEYPESVSNAPDKNSDELDPALVEVDGIHIPEALNSLTTVKTLVLDWFSPTTIQIAKLDKVYKAAWRNKEPIKSQYAFQKNFSSSFKKLTKKLIKEGSIKDLNMASATCVERLQEYVDSEFGGDLAAFLAFLNHYKDQHGSVWEG